MNARNLSAELRVSGFRATRTGQLWKRREIEFVRDGRWPQLRKRSRIQKLVRAAPSQPGFWKREPGRLVFDLPSVVCEPELLGPALRWALQTSSGEEPAGWRPPSSAELSQWIPNQRLVVRHRAELARGRLLSDSGRLALVFEFRCSGNPPSPARTAWLEQLLTDAQLRFRMVRFALSRDGSVVRAEVDLTGAPPELLPVLMPVALDGLTWVVRWLLGPLSLLQSEHAHSVALETFLPVQSPDSPDSPDSQCSPIQGKVTR